MFNQSIARDLEIEQERKDMLVAMDDIAELLNYEHVDKAEIAKIILPFVSETHQSYIAVLAFSE